MPVSTINLNDFLVQKNSGDIVTGDDWNKLIALFHATNVNANALLQLMKAVDANTANIAHVTQGAVPDGSIDYNKLSKIGGTTNKYVLTTDLTPVSGVTYYTLEGTVYIPHIDLAVFEPGTQYYTLETVVTEPAILGPDVIGDGVVENYHLASKTLLPSACSDFLLGGLLNDNATVYTDKGVSGTIPSSTTRTTVEHTITLDKPHKALIIIGAYSVVFLTADINKPDLYIGGSIEGTEDGDALMNNMFIKHLVGDSKRHASPQSYTKLWPLISAADDIETANYPSGLLETSRAYLNRCYYDYETKTVKLRITQLHSSTNYSQASYNFGNLIIGI